MAMWQIAQQYTLADNFFMGAFGGSFFNHMWLVCACAPYYPNADTERGQALDRGGRSGRRDPHARRQFAEVGARRARPSSSSDGNLTPDFYAVNTMQPPYQPSGNPPAPGGDPRFADPSAATTMPPQTEPTIGDLLSAKGVSWAWYSGAWQYVLDQRQRRSRCRTSSTTTSRSTTSRASRPAPRRAPSICATAASAAASSSRRSMPASCRRWRSTSRRAISTSIPATPTSRPATSTSPT